MFPPLMSLISLEDDHFSMSCTKDRSKRQLPFLGRRPKRPAPPDYSITPLYRQCVKQIIKGMRDSRGDMWDLSLLPPSVRRDLYHWNMTLGNGFAKEIHFLHLLPTDVDVIKLTNTVVTDAMLKLVAKRAQVTELHIVASKTEFSRDSLIHCVGNLPLLEKLVVWDCDAVDDEFIEALAEQCKNLRQLVLERCAYITDACARSLSKMQLRELDLSESKVTDQLLIDLQQSPLMCIHLRDINVKNCDMTSNSLRYLNWAKLENVNIIGTRIEDMTCIPENAVFKTLNWSL